MIYQAKTNSAAYQYIKKVVEQREKEFKKYIRRVEEASGISDIRYFQGSTPNRSLDGRYTIYSIGISSLDVDKLDPKVWRIDAHNEGKIYVSPIRRTRKGKAIAEAMKSCASLPNFLDVLDSLFLPHPDAEEFILTSLHYFNNSAFIRCDDNLRADEYNKDLFEVTLRQFEAIRDNEEMSPAQP